MSAWRSILAGIYKFRSPQAGLGTLRGLSTSGGPAPPWEHLGLGGRRPRLAVAMSGGVDSSVAALLLKDRGCDVFGIYMKTWDSLEEDEGACSAERDHDDARRVCAKLGIPLHSVDFVPKYWQDVFSPFLEGCQRGLTPNPDLSCNRKVKFDALLSHALALGADGLATGHYARLLADAEQDPGSNPGPVQLLRAADPSKDQSYFLSRVHQASLARAVFPLGWMGKQEVRERARAAGLDEVAGKRGSAGICFIGRRRFTRFVSQYVERREGTFVSCETGQVVGMHQGIEVYTTGQRARIGGARRPWFVVGKDARSNVVYVCEGTDHPALLSRGAFLSDFHWMSGQPPREMQGGDGLHCAFKARYQQDDGACVIRPAEAAATSGDESSRYTKPLGDVTAGASHYASLEGPVRAVTPHQGFVMYQGEVCLGSALVASPGLSDYERFGLKSSI